MFCVLNQINHDARIHSVVSDLVWLLIIVLGGLTAAELDAAGFGSVMIPELSFGYGIEKMITAGNARGFQKDDLPEFGCSSVVVLSLLSYFVSLVTDC